MAVKRAVVLPELDSPTSPTTSFEWSLRLKSRNAGIRFAPSVKLTDRFSISRRGAGIAQGSPYVQVIAQSLAEQIEADNGKTNGKRWTEQRPIRNTNIALRLVDHDAPIREGGLGAQAEIAQRR